MSYTPPNVEIFEEVSAPQIVPIIASPNDLLLVGPSVGGQIHTDSVVLLENEGKTETIAVKLPYLAELNAISANSASLLEVTIVQKPAEWPKSEAKLYKEITDYRVSLESGTIELVKGGGIPSGTRVEVTYVWVASNYFFPQRFSNVASISQIYGSPLDSTGTKINSPLTLAANLALQNGVGSVILQPLFIEGVEGKKKQPKASEYGLEEVWQTTYNLAQNYVENVDFVVPVGGQGLGYNDETQAKVYFQTQRFLSNMKKEEVFPIAVFGDDSSTSTVGEPRGQAATIRSNAEKLKENFGKSLSQQVVYINTSNFQYALSNNVKENSTLKFIPVGGQYMAAAFAGAVCSRPVANSMTRKSIVGFSAVLDQRTLEAKNLDAEHGLCVIEQIGKNIRCRHSITLDNSSAARQELSVVRAKFNMEASVKETLEDEVIGQIIADANSPFIVRSAIASVLSALQSSKSILDYSTINTAISSINPTIITATFSYRPSFTVNYIKVGFSLNLTAQTIEAFTPTTL